MPYPYTIREEDSMCDNPVAVVNVYGLNLGAPGSQLKREELEAYFDKIASDHPDVRLGWFGSHTDPIAVIYHKYGFHEMYDAGAINKRSCVVTQDNIKSFQTIWDGPIKDCAHEMGYTRFSLFEIQWMVIVTTFPTETYEHEEPLTLVSVG